VQPTSDVTVVIITYNRRTELLRTLAKLTHMPERPNIVVVDNASSDETAHAVAARYADSPAVKLLALNRNFGAVGRNIAIQDIRTRYVAFCDDDSWWEAGALRHGAELLDANPEVAAVTGRIIVEPSGEEDPIVAELRHSPLPPAPGTSMPGIGSFLAAATVMRVDAFRQVGGFSRRLWFGGEEELLSADLMAAGWQLCFAENMAVHHAPSVSRDPDRRRRLGIRNTLWFTWLRRPAGSALRRTGWLLRTIPRDLSSVTALAEAAAGLPWLVRERKVVPAEVEAKLRELDSAQRGSRARRYVS
jgi:GT2 family glycosyltransferase